MVSTFWLILMKVNLLFSSVACPLDVIFKRPLLKPGHKDLLFCFSSQSFVVLALNIWSMIYSESMVMYKVRKGSNLILSNVYIQLSQYHLLKRYFFSH